MHSRKEFKIRQNTKTHENENNSLANRNNTTIQYNSEWRKCQRKKESYSNYIITFINFAFSIALAKHFIFGTNS